MPICKACYFDARRPYKRRVNLFQLVVEIISLATASAARN